MFFIRRAGDRYVDRGDLAADDWATTDFTLDGDWHDLDLSSIIPKNTSLVLFRLVFRDTEPYPYMSFRTKGNTHDVNIGVVWEHFENKYYDATIFVKPNSDGLVQYKTTATSSNNLFLSVGGWWV